MTEERKLGAVSIAALLVSIHYGMGFLLGTAEKAFTQGLAGSLYAIAISGGTLGLVGVGRFYWHRIEPIWTLLGERYGELSAGLVGVMSWISLIGIGAAQIISGSFILRALQLPVIPGMIGLTVLCGILSLLPVEKASWIFRGLLLLNIGVLLYGVWRLGGLPTYVHAPLGFLPAVKQLDPGVIWSTCLSTVMLVLIDMRCQQVVVKARDLNQLYWGCVLAAGIFVMLAVLPPVLIQAAEEVGILPDEVAGQWALLYILSWVGGGTDGPLGLGLVAVLLVPALGAGSGVLRTQTQATVDFVKFLPDPQANRVLLAGINGGLSLAVALRGSEIVDLIVCFYAVYVGAVWVPFLAYILDQTERYTFSESSVRRALLSACLAAIMGLLISLFSPDWLLWQSAVLTILSLSGGIGVVSLMISQGWELWRAVPALEEERGQEKGIS